VPVDRHSARMHSFSANSPRTIASISTTWTGISVRPSTLNASILRRPPMSLRSECHRDRLHKADLINAAGETCDVTKVASTTRDSEGSGAASSASA
jgi:hypothetical protein